MEKAGVALEDRYILQSGRIYLSGVQALVRLPMMQRERDLAAGLNTAGFISGYRGSPLGGYDNALLKAQKFLQQHKVHFQPGLNEDLAATSVWGTQQLHLFPNALVDGVFALWYGKGPGVDRSADVLKHGNEAGSSAHGGVLLVAGDDHGCQSSTLPHQSEQVFAAAMIPVLNPSSVQDYLDFGLYGFALSRFSGCWIGFKAIAETVESSASVHVDPHRVKIVLPEFDMPAGGLNIRWPDPPMEQERRLHGAKMAAIAAFARANPIDTLVLDPPRAHLGIITAGKAYLDVRQALDELGLDNSKAAALGIRLYKVGLTWPLETHGAQRFAEGLQEVLVVEEKRSFIEDQLVHILYNMDAPRRPRVVGKRDEQGAMLLPSEGEMMPTLVARAIVSRLARFGDADSQLMHRLARLEAFECIAEAQPSHGERTPFFCSGCPHNTSTRLPEGSRALAGIGCHGMAMLVPNRNTITSTHMGGEGATWIGQSPFTSDKHVFQNLGDGTYQHSGLLAIRAAAVAGVNITYKILYNDAVAMTGGQTVDGHPSVADITRQVAAEGAKKIVVVTDEPGKYPGDAGFAPGVEICHRDELDRVQRELRETPGLTVLVYDQTCAAEKRRRRKRGLEPDPPRHVVINDAVCEGCGDCSEQSNCISVKPLDTPFGRKRTIAQSACNKDFSCLKGYCPSFVTVLDAKPRRLESRIADAGSELIADLPLPVSPGLDRPYGILITGIGGTGVLTAGALLGMAAHLEGRGCTSLDFTGLAQKNGAVMSHVRIAPAPEDLQAVRLAPGGADLMLGCDMVVAASETALIRIRHGATRAIINADLQPTAAFVMDNDIDFQGEAMQWTLKAVCGDAHVEFIDATRLATELMGDSIATNVFMLGYALQKGLIPLRLESIERAIELNGVAVEANKRTLAWGRLAAQGGARFEAIAGPAKRPDELEAFDLAAIIDRRADYLTQYQDEAYARRYREFVAAVLDGETARANDGTPLAEAVAHSLFKLMAYKDEYEVARLYSDGAFIGKLNRQFEGNFRLEFHLAPPLLARRNPETGHLEKKTYGGWVLRAFAILARLKGLRGSRLDPFGHTAERRMERRLIDEYEALVRELVDGLAPGNHALAVEIARLPERIRGFGHVKQRSVAKAKEREARLLADFRGGRSPAVVTQKLVRTPAKSRNSSNPAAATRN
ncbi:MAG TPA: indolepyruvate ferredoxin oxidoreductase family protein [Burkholderiales bacterium]|jgi:indolepyruvate ferredoxin oxidoreductase|nr:indolepyruvate ferredoxin oxidoreductase family protein [Burkholderiales bacterium]